jgi:peroxiredoxin
MIDERLQDLASASGRDTEGRMVQLGDLWRERSVVLVFVRHFGCIFCRQQVAELKDIVGQIEARGAELVVVGNGRVEDARRFAREQGIGFRLLTDPTGEAYRRAGMRHGLATVVGAGVLGRGLVAWARGFRQAEVLGDPLQQGGVLVIAAGGREVFRYVSRRAGDHPSTAQLIAVLNSGAVAPALSDRVHT